MNEIDVLNAARKALIERYPQTFKEGNVWVVAFPRESPQISNEAYQLFPSGSSFDAQDGGNLRERFSFGVRIWMRVVSDQMTLHAALLENLANRVRLVTKSLHQHYESEISQQEPMFLEGQSPVRAVESDDSGTYAYVELTFRTIVVSSYESLLEE